MKFYLKTLASERVPSQMDVAHPRTAATRPPAQSRSIMTVNFLRGDHTKMARAAIIDAVAAHRCERTRSFRFLCAMSACSVAIRSGMCRPRVDRCASAMARASIPSRFWRPSSQRLGIASTP